MEAFLSPGLSPAAADAQLNQVYDQHTWIGTTASIAVPLILIAIVALAVVALRHRLTPHAGGRRNARDGAVSLLRRWR